MFIDATRGSMRRRTTRVRLHSAVLATALLATALSCLRVSAVRAQSLTNRNSSPLESLVDASIKPGEDFFAYANGSWLEATEIPAGKDRWSARNEIEELTRQRVAQLLDGARTASAGSTERKVADFRAAYLNEAAIDAAGIAPVRQLLDSIDFVQDKAALCKAGSDCRTARTTSAPSPACARCEPPT